MRVLVTGSHGYIGSVLGPALKRRGHDVAGLDTLYFEGCDFGPDPEPLATVRADVRSITSDDLRGFDAVVHLAALSNDPIGELNPEWTSEINHEGSVHVARAARDAGVGRFIFASSCSMYGASGTDEFLGEDAALRPLTAYATSKVRAEEAVLALADSDFTSVSMRNATVYGVSPRLRLDIVLNNLAAWAHTTGSVRLLSDGSSWRPLVHVRDLAEVVQLILDAPPDRVSGESFNVGFQDQNYRVRELAEILASETGADVEFAAEATPDPRSYRVDFAKLERTFPELRPAWNAQRGAQELIEAYRAVGLTAADFEGRKYIRIRQLQHLLDRGELDETLSWERGPNSR